MPTIEKTVHVEQHVDDLWGLYLDLRKAAFKVKNVGSDNRGTYIYMDLDEDKDPSPIVESWVGKAAPNPSPLLRNVRVKELEKAEEEHRARVQEELEAKRRMEEARARGDGGIPLPEPPKPEPETSVEKIGFLKKIFRKFF